MRVATCNISPPGRWPLSYNCGLPCVILCEKSTPDVILLWYTYNSLQVLESPTYVIECVVFIEYLRNGKLVESLFHYVMYNKRHNRYTLTFQHLVRRLTTQNSINKPTIPIIAVCFMLHVLYVNRWTPGTVSIPDKASYCEISWSIEAARLVVYTMASLWNLTVTPTVLMPKCM